VLLEKLYTRFGLVYTNVGEVASGAMWMARDAREERRPVPGLPLLECRTCNTPRAPDRMPPDMVVPPGTSAELDRALAGVFPDFPRTFELFELFDAHQPQDPHYYLQFIGVQPECQGTGIGSALLRAVLDRCDLEGAAAYLEADEWSRLLYEKHGFEATAELRMPEGPSIFPMWRAPAIPGGPNSSSRRPIATAGSKSSSAASRAPAPMGGPCRRGDQELQPGCLRSNDNVSLALSPSHPRERTGNNGKRMGITETQTSDSER
jgi:GNAT superfamily N-acetyltransferase